MGARRAWPRRGGWGINLLLRAVIVGFAAEAALAAEDARFADKGIAVRNVVFAGTALTLLFPLVHAVRDGRRTTYPLLADSLFLSILAVDMAANSLNLYERPWRFDLIPHTYGPMAGFATLRTLGVSAVPGAMLVNVAHLAMEIQEAAADALFGTHNVRGWWDTIGDVGAGLIGSIAIPWLWAHGRAARRRVGEAIPNPSLG